MTIGEDRVRINLHTKITWSDDLVVEMIKQKTAELIDLSEQLKSKDVRLASLAQTHYETACLWAVKAATTP